MEEVLIAEYINRANTMHLQGTQCKEHVVWGSFKGLSKYMTFKFYSFKTSY